MHVPYRHVVSLIRIPVFQFHKDFFYPKHGLRTWALVGKKGCIAGGGGGGGGVVVLWATRCLLSVSEIPRGGEEEGGRGKEGDSQYFRTLPAVCVAYSMC